MGCERDGGHRSNPSLTAQPNTPLLHLGIVCAAVAWSRAVRLYRTALTRQEGKGLASGMRDDKKRFKTWRASPESRLICQPSALQSPFSLQTDWRGDESCGVNLPFLKSSGPRAAQPGKQDL